MRKYALVLSSNIENAPYINYYVDVFNEHKIDFIVFYWNKESLKKKYEYPVVSYDKSFSVHSSKLSKIINICKYVRFIRRTLKQENITDLILFTIPPSIFLYSFLVKYYWKHFILDIRDYSPLVPFCSSWLGKVVNASFRTCISSEGFLSWLPNHSNYILSHNLRKSLLIQNNDDSICFENHSKICILTIGQIRDYNMNSEVLQILMSYQSDFVLHYAGYGVVYDRLQRLSVNQKNVFFVGRYMKEDEYKIIQPCDFINALTSVDALNKDIMTNRFYLSILYYKPLLVSAGTYQAVLVEKYGLGIVVKDIRQLPDLIKRYYKTFDFYDFKNRCMTVQKIVFQDILKFEKELLEFIKVG